jgi:hypothetical protein
VKCKAIRDKKERFIFYLLRKVAGKGGIVAIVSRVKAATGVSSWRGGQGIAGVSEIEETPRITPVFGV